MASFAVDVDGTIDSDPNSFASLMSSLVAAGHTVVVLTGSSSPKTKVSDKENYLSSLGINKKNGNEPGGQYDQLVVLPNSNSKTLPQEKADWCKDNGIDVLIDNDKKNAKAATSKGVTALVPWASREPRSNSWEIYIRKNISPAKKSFDKAWERYKLNETDENKEAFNAASKKYHDELIANGEVPDFDDSKYHVDFSGHFAMNEKPTKDHIKKVNPHSKGFIHKNWSDYSPEVRDIEKGLDDDFWKDRQVLRGPHGYFEGSTPFSGKTFEDFSKMKPSSGPLGSNGGIWREDKKGSKYLIKPAEDDAHAYNEVASGIVYKHAGVKFPETGVVHDKAGNPHVVSKKIDGLKQLSAGEWEKNPELQKKAAADFGTDALLSHWDVSGLSADNTLVDKNGDPVRIEAGGAMAFRAQGGDKSSFQPGKPWVEPESMRTSPQGKTMYGKMTDEEAANSLEKAGKIDLTKVREDWDKNGVPAPLADKWQKTLEERQAQIPELVSNLRGDAKDPLDTSYMHGQIGAIQSHEAMANLENVFNRAGPKADEYSKWYENEHQHLWDIAKQNNIDPYVFAGMVAATSPRTSWVSKAGRYNNIELALKAANIAEARKGETAQEIAKNIESPGMMRNNLYNALRIYQGEDPGNVLQACKTRSFYNNLAFPGKTDSVTMDTWMANALAGREIDGNAEVKKWLGNGDKSVGSVKSYGWAADMVRTNAAKHNMSPDAYQSVIWSVLANRGSDKNVDS